MWTYPECRGSSGTAFTQDSDRLSPVVRFRGLSYMTRTHLSKPNVNKIVHDNTYPPDTRSKKYIVCLYHHHLYVANEFPQITSACYDRSIRGRGSHFSLQLARVVRDPWSIDCRIDEVDIIESELYEGSNTLAGEGNFRFDLSTARHHIALLALCSHVVGDEPLVIFILLSRLRLAFTTRKNRVPTCLHILLYRCKLVVHSEFPLTKIYERHEAVLI